MPFGLQPMHLLVIAIIALLIFGPKRLPEMGRGIGRAWMEFRKGSREMAESFREEVSKANEESEGATAAKAPEDHPAMFCNKCGGRNPAESSFCNRCGVKIGA